MAETDSKVTVEKGQNVRSNLDRSTTAGKTSKVTTHSSSQYKHKWTYEERLEFALRNGMDRSKAEEWAKAQYSGVADSPLEFGIFRKTSSQRRDEENEAADVEFYNKLLDEQRMMEENSPSAEAERYQNAGVNVDLTGGDQLGSGDATGIDDTSSSQSADQVAALNAQAAELGGRIASGLMTAAGTVMNLANAGVDIDKNILGMDVQSGQAVFDTIKGISNIGNFFPFLGVQYDPEENNWYDLDDSSVRLDTATVRGLSPGEFVSRIQKRYPHFGRRYIENVLYPSYRGMMSPAAINAYMEERKRNISLQNETIDEAVKGVPRTGALTSPSPHIGQSGFALGSKYENSLDSDVFDYFVQTAADLELYSLKAQNAHSKNQLNYETVNKDIYSAVFDLVKRLKADASKGSAVANYLLVSMMSDSFNGIAEAALLSNNPFGSKPSTFKDALGQVKDAGVMSFLGLKQYFPSLKLNKKL